MSASPPPPSARRRTGPLPGVAPLTAFWLVWGVLVLVPLLGLLAWSLLTTEGFRVALDPSLDAYLSLFGSGRWAVTARTIRIAATVTAIELVLAFPFAFWLAKGVRSPTVRALTLALLTVPFFLSISARTIVWRAVLGTNGLVNTVLLDVGVIDAPLDWLLFSEVAVHLGLVGPYFPTMALPIFLAILMIDDDLLEASRDLGASWSYTMRHVVLPLSMPGIAAGIIFTFVPMLGEDVVPTLLGGGHVQLIGASVYSLLTVLNYSVAAAISVLVLAMMAAVAGLLRLLMPGGGFGALFAALER